MPESLWERAVELARVRGVHSIARAVRLDYYSLKRRLTAAAKTAPQRAQHFVEVAVTPGTRETSAPAAAVVEVELRNGGRMRLHSVTAAGLAVLCESIWRSRGRA